MSTDHVIRVMTDDHSFRVIACDTTETVRRILEVQDAKGPTAQALAELVTATVLLRETMAPNLRVQGIAKSAHGRGSLLGDSHPDGGTRGLAQLKVADQGFTFGPGAVLQMVRSLPNGSLHQGIVDLDGITEGGTASGISKALMVYLQESEQVVSVASVSARFSATDLSNATLARSGGYVVQLLPEAERPTHMIMTQRLEEFSALDTLLDDPGFGAQLLIDELLYGMPFTELARADVMFECKCSEASLLSALATLGRAEIKSMVDEGAGLDITCDYCRTDYSIAIERLRALLDDS